MPHHSRARSACALLLSGALIAATPAMAGQIPLGTHGEVGSVGFGGLLQPRAENDRRTDGNHRTEASLRRAWLDIRGELHAPGIAFRMQLDMSGDASVRDLWLQYALGDTWALRLGQYTAPFALSRAIGGPNRTFTEIGVAANQFQIPQGRDTGLGLLGSAPDGRWQAAINVFDGRGRLDSRGDDHPSSDGVLVTGRAAYALLGEVPAQTSTLGYARQPAALSVGAGAMAATENHLRDWALDSDDDVANQRADWATGTVDVVAGGGPVTATAAGFLRRVSPEQGPGYDDQGWEIEAALALPVVDQEIAVRRSELRRDVANDRPNALQRGGVSEWSMGWNAYHDGHHRKTQIFALRTRGGDQPSDWTVQAQHQLRF